MAEDAKSETRDVNKELFCIHMAPSTPLVDYCINKQTLLIHSSDNEMGEQLHIVDGFQEFV